MIRHEAAKPKPAPMQRQNPDCFCSNTRCVNHGPACRLKVAKAQPGIAVAANGLDVDPWLVNVANGTIDLRTGFRPHDRRDLLTKLAPVEYRPGLRDERWNACRMRPGAMRS